MNSKLKHELPIVLLECGLKEITSSITQLFKGRDDRLIQITSDAIDLLKNPEIGIKNDYTDVIKVLKKLKRNKAYDAPDNITDKVLRKKIQRELNSEMNYAITLLEQHSI